MAIKNHVTRLALLFFLGVLWTGCAPEPVTVLSVGGPDTLNTNEAGTFTAQLASAESDDEHPGYPVEFEWSFGDGASDSGRLENRQAGRRVSAEHAYGSGGTYTVALMATNGDGENRDEARKEVHVVAPPEIITLNSSAAGQTIDPGQSVEFSATVEGTAPFDYRWQFGDGETARQEAPSHAYDTPGQQNVELRVSNRAGSDRRSLTLQVEEAYDPCEQVTALNTVHFAFDKSHLTGEAEGLLSENVDALSDCPDIAVQVNAYTDHVGGDQYNLRLSERRARSVEDYYTGSGIPASRIQTTGMGKAPTPCLKEDPGPGCRRNRRAESIPQQ